MVRRELSRSSKRSWPPPQAPMRPTPAQERLLKMAELIELAERATVADEFRIISEAALAVFGHQDERYKRVLRLLEAGASLDAAITLVPEGQDCSLWWGMRGGNVTATAEIDGAAVAIAATPALALCAVSLRAKAQPGDAE